MFWVDMVRNWCGQSGHGILKLAVSQEWIDGMDWFLACWCKFKKAKSYFNDFWVDLVKNYFGHLVHKTLKSAEWVYGLSWFFACWVQCNKFLLDHHHFFYLWLLNASLLQLYLLAHWQYLEGFYEIGCVYPSLLTSVRAFSWNLIMRLLWILPWC